MTPIDLTAKSPPDYRMRSRAPDSITTVVVHQMGCGGAWKPESPTWARVRSHYVVRFDGSVLKLHDPAVRMYVGSDSANSFSITIEHQGNYPSDRGAWYQGGKFGCDEVDAHPEMVRASRELIRSLVRDYPSIREVMAHRQLSASRPNCPGPDLWREVGEWAVSALGLRADRPPVKGGLPIPDTWRGERVIV